MQEAKELLELIKQKNEHERKKAQLEKDIYIQEQKLYDTMSSMNMDKFTIDGIEFKTANERSFSIDQEAGVAIKWDDLPVFDWFREHNMGDLIKSKESIHHTQRTASLKLHVDEGGELPPFIKQTIRDTVKYNKKATGKL